MPALVMVMAAHGVGVELQPASQPRLHTFVRVSRYAGEELDSGIGQSGSGPAADPTADKNAHLQIFQKTGQGPVAAACGADDLRRLYLLILHFINLEGPAVAEVLEYFSVFVGDGNFPNIDTSFIMGRANPRYDELFA